MKSAKKRRKMIVSITTAGCVWLMMVLYTVHAFTQLQGVKKLRRMELAMQWRFTKGMGSLKEMVSNERKSGEQMIASMTVMIQTCGAQQGLIGTENELYFHPSKSASLVNVPSSVVSKPITIPIFPCGTVLCPHACDW